MAQTKENSTLLIQECLRGKKNAQRRLFELYYPYVYSICIRYGKQDHTAQEMLNDSFYRCFNKLDQYDTELPFKPWLRRLCVNCCLRYLEKHKPKIKYESSPIDEYSLTTEETYLPDATDLNYLKLLIHLPEACRIIINLYVIEEYKHQEIAEMLNISVGTSKSNLHRAKKLLYDMVEKDGRNMLKLKSDYGR